MIAVEVVWAVVIGGTGSTAGDTLPGSNLADLCFPTVSIVIACKVWVTEARLVIAAGPHRACPTRAAADAFVVGATKSPTGDLPVPFALGALRAIILFQLAGL